MLRKFDIKCLMDPLHLTSDDVLDILFLVVDSTDLPEVNNRATILSSLHPLHRACSIDRGSHLTRKIFHGPTRYRRESSVRLIDL